MDSQEEVSKYIKTLETLVKEYEEICYDYSKIFRQNMDHNIFLFSALMASIVINVYLIGKYLF